MSTGTVKWFNNAKGYGFILPDEGSGDLFAHYSAIDMEGYRTLKAGQAVTFDKAQGEKGMHAINIRLATQAAPTAPSSPVHDTNGSPVRETEANTPIDHHS